MRRGLGVKARGVLSLRTRAQRGELYGAHSYSSIETLYGGYVPAWLRRVLRPVFTRVSGAARKKPGDHREKGEKPGMRRGRKQRRMPHTGSVYDAI